jgi:hypothetical protein
MSNPQHANLSLEFDFVTCYRCGVPIWMETWILKKRRNDHQSFFCYNGHSQSFSDETEAARLKRQLDRERGLTRMARDEAANERARAEHLGRSRDVYKGKLKATKQRIKNGVCPCCKRTFANLHDHMSTQHPDYGES